jgi:cytosine/adenosine deaminase-related metal-dependent hydrolase
VGGGPLAQWQSCGLLIRRFRVRVPGGPLSRASGTARIRTFHATTKSAAELCGVADELGAIEQGKRPDLTFFNGHVFDIVPTGSETMRESDAQMRMDRRVVDNQA